VKAHPQVLLANEKKLEIPLAYRVEYAYIVSITEARTQQVSVGSVDSKKSATRLPENYT
jgi:hypothetical protein